MFEDIQFWDIVTEVYPLFLKYCLLAGIWRMSKGVHEEIAKRNKKEGHFLSGPSLR